MVNLEKAIEIATNNNPGCYARSAIDFGEFYVFEMVPLFVKEDDFYETGCYFPAVDKKSDKYYIYDITSDIDLFDASKKIF